MTGNVFWQTQLFKAQIKWMTKKIVIRKIKGTNFRIFLEPWTLKSYCETPRSAAQFWELFSSYGFFEKCFESATHPCNSVNLIIRLKVQTFKVPGSQKFENLWLSIFLIIGRFFILFVFLIVVFARKRCLLFWKKR